MPTGVARRRPRIARSIAADLLALGAVPARRIAPSRIEIDDHAAAAHPDAGGDFLGGPLAHGRFG
jgi:hypothetical protein